MNLLCSEEQGADAALHLNPRLDTSEVVFNNLAQGAWGKEERGPGLPFRRGQPFELLLIVTGDGYKVWCCCSCCCCCWCGGTGCPTELPQATGSAGRRPRTGEPGSPGWVSSGEGWAGTQLWTARLPGQGHLSQDPWTRWT